MGAVVSGFQVEGRTFSGSQLDWLTPFNLFCGVGLVVTYALLGATWLIMKAKIRCIAGCARCRARC